MTAEENRFRERRSAYNPEEAEADKPDADEPAGESGETIVGPGGEPVSAEPSSETASRPEPTEPGAEASTGPDDLDALDDVEVPPASFQEIAEPLVMRALQFLGEVPLTEGGDRKVVPRLAKHMIDLIEILEDRTRGNLEDEEKRYLERVLSELRTRYVGVTQ